MIRINKWMGFVTYASPYFIPAGGGVEQTNMVCLLPGQVSCRLGMESVTPTDPNTNKPEVWGAEGALEMWGYTIGRDTDKVFVFTGDGNILIKEAPEI